MSLPGLSLRTPAKINLALHVGAIQPDGYHPVDTLCTFLDAGDELTLVGEVDQPVLTIDGPYAAELTGSEQNNLITKATSLMALRSSMPPLHFHLHKAVPPASGIGGGTANGVGALLLINECLQKPLSGQDLIETSIGLGADGPVCMAGMISEAPLWRARGIGEVIARGPDAPTFWLVLTNHGEAVSTGAVFRAFDERPAPTPFDLEPPDDFPDVPKLGQFLKSQRNDLMAPAIAVAPQIANRIDRMQEQAGCQFAAMTGSGATVFGLFAEKSVAETASQNFAADGDWTAFGKAGGGHGAAFTA